MKAEDRSLLESQLVGKGIRLTRQRRILLNLIESASEHLHAGDLLRLARDRDQRIDRSTVYRTLSLLKEEGLIEELDLLHLDGSEHYYEVRNRKAHTHIGCTGCGKIVEYQTDLVTRLESEIHRRTGFEVNSVRIEVSAFCRDCQHDRQRHDN